MITSGINSISKAGQTAFSFWFVVGNMAVTLATNLLFDCYINDMETGYKVLRSDLWRRLSLKGTRFDIEPDITARVLRLGYRIHEVPIRYYARSRSEGKKLTWLDGVRALGTLLRLRERPVEALAAAGSRLVQPHSLFDPGLRELDAVDRHGLGQ